jgi:acyl carrier protein
MTNTTDTTGRIVEILCTLLKTNDVDGDSSFADIGVTSLTAVRMRSRIRTQLGREIELMSIVENPTARRLAEIVDQAPKWDGAQYWSQLSWTDEGQGGAGHGDAG